MIENSEIDLSISDGKLNIETYDCGISLSRKRTNELYVLLKKYYEKKKYGGG